MKFFKLIGVGICITFNVLIAIAGLIKLLQAETAPIVNFITFMIFMLPAIIVGGIGLYKQKLKIFMIRYCVVMTPIYILIGIFVGINLMRDSDNLTNSSLTEFSNKYFLDGFYLRVGQTKDVLLAELGEPNEISSASSRSVIFTYNGVNKREWIEQREIFEIQNNKVISAIYVLVGISSSEVVDRKQRLIERLESAGFKNTPNRADGMLTYKKNNITLDIFHGINDDGKCNIVIQFIK